MARGPLRLGYQPACARPPAEWQRRLARSAASSARGVVLHREGEPSQQLDRLPHAQHPTAEQDQLEHRRLASRHLDERRPRGLVRPRVTLRFEPPTPTL